MSACELMVELWPKKVRTKIVGTTFENRQDVLAKCREQNIRQLRLVPEPTNKYDPFAVAVVADIRDSNSKSETLQLGYLSNCDRVCSDCGQVVGGSYFENSKTLQCPMCCKVFGTGDTVITQGADGEPVIECPRCGFEVDLDAHKLVICPRCKGADFGRAGLATRFFRAIAAGQNYEVIVTDYTGGDIGPGGRKKTLGCNIIIRRR